MRPKDWKKGIEVRDDEKRYTGTDLNKMYEAGADAMLEGLKKELDIDDIKAYGSQCLKCLVFIEESNVTE